MRKFLLFFVSLAALSVLSSCHLHMLMKGSYKAKLYKVEEIFNNEVVQTFTPDGSFKENGITYLEEYVEFARIKDYYDDNMKYQVQTLPIGDHKASCNLLWEKKGESAFQCYFFTDKTKKEDCEWFDNFMWVDIYQDKAGYLYRFGDDGTAVELSRTKNSQGKWVYWDSLKAYYKFYESIATED